jgi:hypothetical protein
MDQGAKIGGAALTAAATGNPLPLILQGFQSVGWLFGVGSAAVAVHQKRKLTKATTWDHQTERRQRRGWTGADRRGGNNDTNPAQLTTAAVPFTPPASLRMPYAAGSNEATAPAGGPLADNKAA